MSLKESLKDRWNRIACFLDGENVGIFSSAAVDNKLREQGWKITFNHIAVPIAYPGVGVVPLTTIHNPRGEHVSSAEQRQEYLAARKQAAKIVYGLA